MPDLLKEFDRHTDANDNGYGAALIKQGIKKVDR